MFLEQIDGNNRVTRNNEGRNMPEESDIYVCHCSF